MTVSAETNSVTYSCNGVLTEFTFDFKVFKPADVKVILVTVATGAETVLTETTHYAITGSLSSGGKVTTVATYSSDYKLFICLDMDVEQATDLIYGGTYSSEAIETMSDKLTKMVQQFVEKLGRAITFKITSDESNIELEDLVADRSLVVNSAGTGLEMGPSTTEISNAQTYAEAAQTAQTAAELAETHAETAETNAETAETNAAASAVAAAASAAAAGHPISYVKTMTGNETPAYVQGYSTINHLDPGGADRTFNPTASFPAGYEMVVINTGEEIVTFDSTGLGQAVGPGQKITFYFDGTSWF